MGSRQAKWSANQASSRRGVSAQSRAPAGVGGGGARTRRSITERVSYGANSMPRAGAASSARISAAR